MATVPACAGPKARPSEASRLWKAEPSVLPRRESVWVRLSHPAGSLSTTRSTSRAVPRSTCSHCGKEPAGPSQ
ncbi:hypothetical protein RKD31_001239 [Streptomyces sp. SAI-163]